MVRIRKVAAFGNSFCIRLVKRDLLELDLKVGDFVDIEDIIKVEAKENE